ncbi:MAG: hypothetical protein OXG25_11550 [Gammaproteobacteria bacterium]|nr:hypothetical protein [Gammaproteobacteria bacterium]
MVIGRSPEETYWEFFRADRAKDAKAWAAVMNFPHVRVAAPGRIEYFRTEEEFVAATDWTERIATGWVRTEGIEPRVIQFARYKVHLAGGWVRYNAENEPILANRVVYVLTRVKDSWCVQARLACGATATWKQVADEGSGNFVTHFLELFGHGEVEACASLIRYPFVVVGKGTVCRFESKTSFIQTLSQLHMSPIEIDDIALVQNGQKGANFGVSFATDDGRSDHAICLIDKRHEDYRLTAISLISC